MHDVCVFGATGMLGRSVVSAFRNKGGYRVLEPTRQEVDLFDKESIEIYIEDESPESVVMCAGVVGGINDNLARKYEYLYANALMNINVIDACKTLGMPVLTNVSSSCIYPTFCPQPMKEEQLFTGPFEPTNEGYAIAKAMGVKLIEYAHKEGWNWRTAILCNLYGANDNWDPDTCHVIPALLTKVYKAKKNGDKEFTLNGTGSARREFMWVMDAALGIVELHDINVNHPYCGMDHTYNMGYGEDISIIELLHLIFELFDYYPTIKFDRMYPDGMSRKLMDSSKLGSFLWKPKVHLKEGLRTLIAERFPQ